MTAPAQLVSVLEAGGPSLSRQLERTEARLAEVAGSHGAELARHAAGTLAAGGKRLRPVLVFLCGGDGAALLPAGVAVELLHMATLVHDDVLDQAPLRRGKPTVFATDGRGAATATGDLLFSRAFAELAATGSEAAVAALSSASSALARGELMQRADAWSDSVTPERYLQRCEMKTASLFSAACRLGAVLGDAPAAEAALASFGRRVGLAFQILDDVLDVSGPIERTGKHRGTDLLDGTVTLPLIVARERDPELRTMDLKQAVTDAGRSGGPLRPDRKDRGPGRVKGAGDGARGGGKVGPHRRRAATRASPRAPPGGRRRGGALRLRPEAWDEARGLEVLRKNRAALKRRGKRVHLSGHVGPRQAAKIGGQGVGGHIQALVEGVDGLLGEHALADVLAFGASQHHFPGVALSLLPAGRVDQLGVALGADVERLVRLDRRAKSRSGLGLLDGVLEVDDLDRLAARELHPLHVVGLLFHTLFIGPHPGDLRGVRPTRE